MAQMSEPVEINWKKGTSSTIENTADIAGTMMMADESWRGNLLFKGVKIVPNPNLFYSTWQSDKKQNGLWEAMKNVFG